MAAALPRAGIRYHCLGETLGGYRTGGYKVYLLEVGQAWTPDIPEVSSSEPSLPGVLDVESRQYQ